ncbi:MAG: Hsp20/alpha crystallin family protein [Deltaproteobacteria bacterium]|nr:Hsp20/alpha crystallin family protein [Deltaproteobacteria bacterium]
MSLTFTTERIVSLMIPVVDVYEKDDSIFITAEMPGVDKENIEIDVKGRSLTLKGERTVDQETEQDSYHRRERFFGKLERTFNLASEVDPDSIHAEYKDGILKIEIPKPESAKPKQITVH